MKQWYILLFVIAIIGMADAGYLTYEHFSGSIPPCTQYAFLGDCGQVLRSQYSVIFGVPLALLGFGYYSVMASLLTSLYQEESSLIKKFTLVLSGAGFVSSLYFVYLQLVILKAICAFCMVSAVTSSTLFVLILFLFSDERKALFAGVLKILYRYIFKPFFFLMDPEFVHEHMTKFGQLFIGSNVVGRAVTSFFFKYGHPALIQKIAHISFPNPVGLAAGFDYQAQLTRVLPSIGFGFGTVGTITNHAYAGNPGPRLGRLPKSKSLLVNKGFKNLGAKQTATILNGLPFENPVGISVGRTNTKKLVTQKQSIEDIVEAFKTFEASNMNHAYYELNISCPNLFGNVTFYPPKNLEALLKAVDALELSRPVFVKMPIEKTDAETVAMLDVIVKHSPVGVIFGNLQKNRQHPSLDQDEVKTIGKGNFSGKPTFERSNELIALAYKKYHKRLIIIGCGGIFSVDDAYTKIKLGATLLQLITGMIFEGPQLIADLNRGLVDRLSQDGYTHISEAIGASHRRRKK